MCFPYIIKRNFLAKTWKRSVDFILLFTVLICLASVVVGFGYFSVVRQKCKVIWSCNVVKRAAWNYIHCAFP